MIVNIENLNEKNCEGCPFLQYGQTSYWYCELGFNVISKGRVYSYIPIRPQKCRDKNVILYDTSKNRRETK